MLLLALTLTLRSPALAEAPGGSTLAAAPAATAGISDDLLARYDAVRAALVLDDLAGARAAALALGESVPTDAPVVSAVAGIAAGPDLATARTAFSGLTAALVPRLAATSRKVLVYYCPMFTGYAYWLQARPGLANPYMGQSMPACGEERSGKAAARALGTP